MAITLIFFDNPEDFIKSVMTEREKIGDVTPAYCNAKKNQCDIRKNYGCIGCENYLGG